MIGAYYIKNNIETQTFLKKNNFLNRDSVDTSNNSDMLWVDFDFKMYQSADKSATEVSLNSAGYTKCNLTIFTK